MNTLEEHVLTLIGEDPDAPDVFLDTDEGMKPIRDSLNDAIEEISLVTGAYRRKLYVPLKAGRNFIRLALASDDIAWIVSVFLNGIGRPLDQTSLTWLNAYNPRWMENFGNPERYVPIADDILLVHPAPSADNDLLIIDAAMIPARYTSDTDRIKVRDNYRWAAVHFAVGEFWASRGDAQSAMDSHQRYLELVKGITEYRPAADRSHYYRSNKTGDKNDLGSPANAN